MRTKLKITEEIIENVNKALYDFEKYISTAKLKSAYNYLISNGGKRFRPLMTNLSTALFTDNHLMGINQSVALELLHNFTLVHDDIMDKSPLRRGKETIYQKWDDTTAILLGDLILGLSCKKLKSNLSPEQGMKAMEIFNHGLVEVCDGQAYDLEFEERTDITLDEYRSMIDKKTGSLIRTSLVIGGIVGNADENQLEKLSELGTELGQAFQLQDDLLDLIGSNQFGKKIGQDIIEGKKTYLIIKANTEAKEECDKELLKKFYDNNGLEENEVDKMRNLLSKLGIIEEVKELINFHFSNAFLIIKELSTNTYSDVMIEILEKYKSRVV
ncbi:MAG: polyprenyl synthetase family protein [Chlorobiota bacterium]